MYSRVVAFMEKNNMLEGLSGMVIGLSGGADSVCLLLLLKRLATEKGMELKAVHVHHGIRGDEADGDLEFCRRLCKSLDVELKEYFYDVPKYASENGLTLEEAGRILRYESFERERRPGFKIAVAHHMNDQAETVLFNLCRGSGIRGLRGMLPTRDNIMRPLLCCTRKEIEEYLKGRKTGFRTDSTNLDTRYCRNGIRNMVLPYLEKNIHGGTVRNIASLAARAGEAEEYLEGLTGEKYAKKSIKTNEGILLKNLEEEAPYMAKRLVFKAIEDLNASLKDIGEVHLDRVVGLINTQSGREVPIHGGLMAKKMQDGIFLYRSGEKARISYEITVPGCTRIPGKGTWKFELISRDELKKISNEPYTKCFDYDKIQCNMLLRTRIKGDRIGIDDKGHHKRLKQFFIDGKIPERDRDEVILLAAGNDILWVTGGRMGADYKISETTRQVLRVSFEKEN